MCGAFMLDLWDDSAEYLVLDDFQDDSRFLYLYKQFFGAQKEFVLTDKYRKKKCVKWGKTIIWLNNKKPQALIDHDPEWWDLNVISDKIDNKLYE